MLRKALKACCLAAILAGAFVQMNAGNLVTDPGFENGTPGSYTASMLDGWLVTAGTGAICNVSHAGCGNVGPAHTGTQMSFLDWSNTLNTIEETLPTVAGDSYTISYWVSDTHANSLEVQFGGSTLFNGAAPTSGQYEFFSYTVTATSTSTVLAFSGQRSTGSGGTLLDDVSVTANPTPEPTTLLLTSVGLLGLGRLRRRGSHSI